MDGLDSHVVVHSLLHKSRISERLTLLRHNHRIKSNQSRQMEQNVGLVVTQAADRVLPVMRVREGADDQVWQSIEIEHFLKVADAVGRDV